MAKGNKDEKEQLAPIVIKRIKKVAGGHHGGAWKVAYADFVTAMMAFFLLLWLLNVTTEEQKNAISNYFDPSHPKISDVVSGAGGILGGLTMTPEGAMVSTVQPIVQPDVPDTTTRGALQGQTEGQDIDINNVRDMATELLEKELRMREDERFKKAADDLKKEIAKTPELKDLQQNLLVDITPEGLRIQIIDDKGRSMFPIGSAQMYEFMHKLLLKVSGVIKPLPNQVSVRGHTDSFKYKDPNRYDNWNLSADRAQSSRRVLVEGGLPEPRIENVMGRADREHLDAKNPESEKNRRISIILLRTKLDAKALQAAAKEKAEAAKKAAVEKQKHGLQIVDDTQDNKPAPAASADAQGGEKPAGTKAADGKAEEKPVMGPTQEQPMRPLPTTPSGNQSTFQRQPQVMVFGEQPAPAKDAPLYQGPTQEPIVNKPPTIKTPVFHFDGEPADSPAPAVKEEGAQAPAQHEAPKAEAKQPEAAAAPAPKSMTFGDEPVLTTPTKPSAPALVPEGAKPADDGTRKNLEF
ncbi:MAG: flagellar motor protein MotB [Alphaproteobacteria bacterium]|nr:flagellar motor protein MotB [Alphaproteobacteria bacterium]